MQQGRQAEGQQSCNQKHDDSENVGEQAIPQELD
jgi:hypothetical protein